MKMQRPNGRKPKNKNARKKDDRWDKKLKRLMNPLTDPLLRKGKPEVVLADGHAAFNAAVNCLSNWQRAQWALKGYPGLQDKNPDEVMVFAKLERPAR